MEFWSRVFSSAQLADSVHSQSPDSGFSLSFLQRLYRWDRQTDRQTDDATLFIFRHSWLTSFHLLFPHYISIFLVSPIDLYLLQIHSFSHFIFIFVQSAKFLSFFVYLLFLKLFQLYFFYQSLKFPNFLSLNSYAFSTDCDMINSCVIISRFFKLYFHGITYLLQSTKLLIQIRHFMMSNDEIIDFTAHNTVLHYTQGSYVISIISVYRMPQCPLKDTS